jgi:hypothetical protein
MTSGYGANDVRSGYGANRCQVTGQMMSGYGARCVTTGRLKDETTGLNVQMEHHTDMIVSPTPPPGGGGSLASGSMISPEYSNVGGRGLVTTCRIGRFSALFV